MTLLDATHEPTLRSWVDSAQAPGCGFTIQNLPFVRFRQGAESWRVGVGIGDSILDLARAAAQPGWSPAAAAWLQPLAAGDLAAFMAQGSAAWKGLRQALSQALAAGSAQAAVLQPCLIKQGTGVEFSLPCTVGDYTDFYTGIHHARTVGKLFRPDNPLLPNYQWVPIGYHGRASSIIVEGGTVRRPCGQLKGEAAAPEFAPCKRLDYELELGLWVGQPNALGERLSIDQADSRLFGLTLLNDWSARDIQAWEYQPLGPFLAKSFASSVSPWVVTLEALAPFRRPFMRPAGDPQPLPYLDGEFNRRAGAFDVHLEVWLQSAQMKAAGQPAVRLTRGNMLDAAYWTPAQLVTHHTSNGCNLQVGDLLGTGTLSGPEAGQEGSMLELSRGGKQPFALPSGETRSFLADGDTVTMQAWCEAPGAARVGLGSVSGTIAPAV